MKMMTITILSGPKKTVKEERAAQLRSNDGVLVARRTYQSPENYTDEIYRLRRRVAELTMDRTHLRNELNSERRENGRLRRLMSEKGIRE